MSKLTLKQLDDGIDAVLRNAASLIEEAKLLAQSGFHARAYALSHIAREEIAKTTMLYTAGLRILADHPVDWCRLYKRLRDHNAKLTSDALVAFVNTPEISEGVPLEVLLAGTKIRNEWKNDSLYVGLKDAVFRTPAEMITPRKAERTICLAVIALEEAKNYISGSGKLTKRDPTEAKKTFAHVKSGKMKPGEALDFMERLTKLSNRSQNARPGNGVQEGPTVGVP